MGAPQTFIEPKYGAFYLNNKVRVHGLVLLVQLSRRVACPWWNLDWPSISLSHPPIFRQSIFSIFQLCSHLEDVCPLHLSYKGSEGTPIPPPGNYLSALPLRYTAHYCSVH